jgi:hypothetical protein
VKRFTEAVTLSSFALMLGIGAMAQSSKPATTTSPVIEITGFANKDYSIRGNVAAELTAKVVKPIDNLLSRAPSDEIIVNIVGCASKDGTEGTNSQYSALRAEAVREALDAQLSARHPGAKVKFTSYPNGAEADARMVKVSWTAIVANPGSRPKPEDSIRFKVLGIAGVLFFIASIVLFSSLKMSGPKDVPVHREIAKIRRKADEKMYDVLITCERKGTLTEKWFCPFAEPNHFRSKRNRILDAAKSGLNRLSESELKELLNKKIIGLSKQ